MIAFVAVWACKNMLIKDEYILNKIELFESDLIPIDRLVCDVLDLKLQSECFSYEGSKFVDALVHNLDQIYAKLDWTLWNGPSLIEDAEPLFNIFDSCYNGYLNKRPSLKTPYALEY